MKRIQEKVKDLVEARNYKSLRDFISEPSQTLAAYHFTDVTADMMAKWLDKVMEVQPQNGAAKALAGYRGVGKSHFLATLGAMVLHPELRSRIAEPHVLASAQRLKRRRHPVAYVRRGTHNTLFEEIKDAIAVALETAPENLNDSLSDLLTFAAEQSADLPFVLIIDTAFDRTARVSREDGILLGELAELAKGLNVFVGVALDDDITGADGINAAIARSYAIDYLDQEHLYRIVDTHLFPKIRQTQHLLHEIFTGYREVLPNFRWGENRFASLYPVHPVILEIAPYVRLYAPEFAILGFASEVGAKILGRPANSLVALDDVFDRVEKSLRKAKDLQEAFATYDSLNSEVIAHIPVMQRLQAKLILKALLILSLDGDGTTAGEISAAMLIYNENDAARSIKSVEDLLETFVSIYPDRVHRIAENGRETRFGLKVSSKDSLNNALAEAAKNVSPQIIEKNLRRFAREKFSDWTLPPENEMSGADTVDCQITWRGGYRRGRVTWNWERRGGVSALINSDNAADFLDWEIIVCHPQNNDAANIQQNDVPLVIWQPAKLRPDEEETLRRYHILLNDTNLQEQFGEQVRAAGHTHQLAVEKSWNRIFIEDGKILIDGFQHLFTDSAKNAQNLSELLTEMLMPLFEIRFQQHPYFEKNLGMNEVSQLVSEHFSGVKQTLPEVQQLAETFAYPLGLVVRLGKNYIIENDEKLLQKPLVREAMALVTASGNETVSLKTIYHTLKKEPYGLVREAQHLVLAALAAQRKIEFVTAKGDRINRRSLDLKIIWDDIVGIAKPSTRLYTSAELTAWAKTLTGVDSFTTIDDPVEAEEIIRSLEKWLEDWTKAQLLERFDALPDEVLNTKIWKISTHARKTFGITAAAVESLIEKVISIDECLQRIADAFSDSEEEFFICTNNLVTLEDFINGVSIRRKISNYLSVCEATRDDSIEEMREALWLIIEKIDQHPGESLNRELDNLWQDFHAGYTEYFAVNHDAVMKSHYLQEKFDEVMRSDEWWEFENLSSLQIFQQKYWLEARRIYRKFREVDCDFDTREMLATHPFCACSFRLSQQNEWDSLPEDLVRTIENGRNAYRKTLAMLGLTLIPLLETFIQKEKPGEFTEAAANLANTFALGGEINLLNNAELIVLGKIIQAIPATPLLQVNLPDETGFVSREELRRQLNKWIDKMPSEPCLLKI